MIATAKNECGPSREMVSTETKMTDNNNTSKTYGRGKLRINLNSPRGNIYALWGIALSVLEQSGYTKEEISENLASLRKDTYEECLEAFGNHKVFRHLFKLYYSPEYLFHLDEDGDEWSGYSEDDEEDSDDEEDW
jgi:hypothetical protein